MPLTELKIQKLKPRDKRYLISDGHGLYIAVMPTGEKFWYVRTWENGRERKRSLGHYPEIGLKEAREMRFNGGAQKDKSLPLGTVAEEWFNKRYVSSVSAWTAYLTRSRLERFILSNFRERDIKSVTPRELLPVLHKIQEKNGLTIGYKVKNILSQIFRYAIAAGYCEWNPAAQISGALMPQADTQHYSVIKTEEQAADVMRAISGYKIPVVAIGLLLLAHTFTRPGEMRLAQWSELDFDNKIWQIPAERMKMRRPHTVPLSTQAAELFMRLRDITNNPVYCFVLPQKTAPISRPAFSTALRELGYGKGKMTPHGFRGMASTLLNERGFSADIIERQLAHAEQNTVRAAYNCAEYLDERRRMMQYWSDFLVSLT